MSKGIVNPAPGNEIRRLREERRLRPVDIQRISDEVKRERDCPDFGISHATLSDIENEHAVPSVRKMFSLAVCLRIPLESILALYGASPEEVKDHRTETGLQPAAPVVSNPPYRLHFDTALDRRRTAPLPSFDLASLSQLTAVVNEEARPSTASYAWIGTEDDTMADLIPGGSLIEIDRSYPPVKISGWSDLRDRPIYFCWTKEGYRCGWCEEDGADLVIVPHPTSHVQARRYRQPRDARIIGRVTHAWVPFGSAKSGNTRPRSMSAR